MQTSCRIKSLNSLFFKNQSFLPREVAEGKDPESYRPRKKGSTRAQNPHNIVFDDDEQAKRYSILIKCKLTPTRYMCEQTLSTLGLKSEVDRLFNNIGLLDFMQRDVPTYKCITIEFLSTLTFKLDKK